MAQSKTKTLSAQAVCQLPIVARRLIEDNKQRQISSKTGGDFRGRLEKTMAYLRWKAGCNTLHDAIEYHRIGTRTRTALRALSEVVCERVEEVQREFQADGLQRISHRARVGVYRAGQRPILSALQLAGLVRLSFRPYSD